MTDGAGVCGKEDGVIRAGQHRAEGIGAIGIHLGGFHHAAGTVHQDGVKAPGIGAGFTRGRDVREGIVSAAIGVIPDFAGDGHAAVHKIIAAIILASGEIDGKQAVSLACVGHVCRGGSDVRDVVCVRDAVVAGGILFHHDVTAGDHATEGVAAACDGHLRGYGSCIVGHAIGVGISEQLHGYSDERNIAAAIAVGVRKDRATNDAEVAIVEEISSGDICVDHGHADLIVGQVACGVPVAAGTGWIGLLHDIVSGRDIWEAVVAGGIGDD